MGAANSVLDVNGLGQQYSLVISDIPLYAFEHPESRPAENAVIGQLDGLLSEQSPSTIIRRQEYKV